MIITDWMMLVLAFVGIWTGATLAVKPIDQIAKKLNSSSFMISFFVLGMFTSLTEISVAFNSYIAKTQEISVGNLLGGSFVLLLFVIPILGILSNGIRLNNRLGIINTFLAISYLLVPHIFLLDKALSLKECAVLFIMYIVLAIVLYAKDKYASNKLVSSNRSIKIPHSKVAFAFFLITVGSVILIFSSNIVVSSIDNIGSSLNVSPFVLSLVLLSFGTNLPEISLAVISALKGKSEIGFGNYLGSALFNLLIMSVLGILSGGISINENFTKLLIFSVFGFLSFFVFIRSKNFLSRKESLVLLTIYVIFVFTELFP